MCFTTRDFERTSRAQFVRSRSFMRTNEILIKQLKDMHKTYSDKVLDFDSPFEKALGILNLMRMDPTLGRKHFESVGVVIAMLNSGDIMAPDIEKQVHKGTVELGEEGEVI